MGIPNHDEAFFFPFGFKSLSDGPKMHKNKWVCPNSYAVVATDERGGYAGHVFAWSPDTFYQGRGGNVMCNVCKYAPKEIQVVGKHGLKYTDTSFFDSEGRQIRVERTYPETNYLFMIGIRQSMRTLAVTKTCRPDRKFRLAEQLVRRACILAQQLGKLYIIVDTPIGHMLSILVNKFGATIIEDEKVLKAIYARDLHIYNGVGHRYQLNVKKILSPV